MHASELRRIECNVPVLLSSDQNPKEEENLMSILAIARSPGLNILQSYHQDAKHLRHKPPVARHARPILHQFPLGAFNIVDDVFGVRVNPLDLLALFRDKGCKLTEHAPQLIDGLFDRRDGIATHVDVAVSRLRLFHHEELLVR